MQEYNNVKKDNNLKKNNKNNITKENITKENKIKENKIKVNLYLSYPNNIYYEMMISPNDIISNLILYIEKFFPKDKYEYVCIYKNDKPIFTNYDTGEEIDISKTYIQHGFYKKEPECNNGYRSDIYEPSCSIKIKLKITKLKEITKCE